MKRATMNVLVTGANGFLGRYVVRQLVARGDRVRGLIRRPDEELSRLGIETVLGDVRDRQAVMAACTDQNAVIHTAAVAGIWGPWQHYYDVNTRGTQHVVQGCLEQGVPRLVFTSSPSVTFDGTDQPGVDESAPYPDRWLCAYPHTKALAEQYVLSQHGHQGLATCALRPHLIWGPGDRHLIPRLIQRARSGRLRQVGDGTNRVDVVYIDNAAQAHLLALDALRHDGPPGGRAYFISQGEPVACWPWINDILALAGLPPLRRRISYRAAWRIGAMLETAYRALRIRREPPMTRFLAAQLATSHWFDIRRARDDFGYVPHISTAEGMQRLGAWLKAERGSG